MSNADNFKSDINKLTESRVRQIMQYVIYCYLKMLEEDKEYPHSERGKIPKEEFLRNGLVNDYLKKSNNKEYYKQYISDNPFVEITFHPEEAMPRNDNKNNLQSTDYIDISIWESNLQSIWNNVSDDEIKFAVECKRIEFWSDTSKYISDIDKFCNGNYTYTRLPFEGQIAFIENATITPALLKIEINKKLNTENLLNEIFINDKYDGTYLSKHQRNVSKQIFSIYHLLLDYSNVVVN